MTNRKLTVLLIAAAAVSLTGCAGQTDSGSATASTSSADSMRIKEQQQQLERLEAELRDKERVIAAKEAELANAQGAPAPVSTAASSLFPPNPKAGECYARVLIPAKYQTTTETVLKREASERIEIIPAKYGPGTERVLVKEASSRLEVVPAVYDNVTETVMVSPASKKIVEVPAKFKTVTERVLDKPAHTAWKRGSAGLQTGSVVDTRTTDTGEIMCLVEVPASYKTITKQVLVEPARTDVVEIPAKFQTVTKTVMVKGPTTREVVIPAEYKTVKTTVLVEPAKERRIPIPAEYETVSKTAKVTDEVLEWRQVLCDVNLTTANVRAIQTALQKAGHYNGPVDGIIGPMTLAGAKSYANAKGLPSGSNYIPVEVTKSLGLKI